MRAEQQARWCLITGQTPQTYYQLSALERQAFMTEAERLGIITRR
jgi:hypothetical protein